MGQIHERADQRRRHAEAGAFGEAEAVVEFFQVSPQREGNHAAAGVGMAGEALVVFLRGGVQGPEDVADGGMCLQEGDDAGGGSVDFFEDGVGAADLRGEPGEIAGVEGLEVGGDAAAEFGGVGAGGVDGGDAGGEVAGARGVFGKAGHDNVGVGEDVDVEDGDDGGVEEEAGTVGATEGGERGEVGGLDEGIGGQLGDDTGDARAVFLENTFEAEVVEDVADIDVVTGSGGELFKDGDRVEVEPAELEPDGAAAGGLEIGDGAERGVDGVHAAIGEEEVGVGGAGEGAAEVAVDLGVGRCVVTGEGFFGEGSGEQAEADKVVFGFAGGEEAADILEISLGARGGGGVGEVR